MGSGKACANPNLIKKPWMHMVSILKGKKHGPVKQNEGTSIHVKKNSFVNLNPFDIIR